MIILSTPLLFILVLAGEFDPAEKIDVNEANKENLQEIHGIGSTIAERIIEMRKICYFYPLSSLMEVKGIGEVTFNKIEEQGKAFVQFPKDAENTVFCRTLKEEISEKNEGEIEITKIDVNTASLEDLIKIVHIGETRGLELIALRPFYSLDQLAEIKGVGDKSLQDIKEQKLAWIDPSLKKPETEAEAGKKEIELIKTSSNGQKKPFLSSLIALVFAFFSGTIILILKNKTKIS